MNQIEGDKKAKVSLSLFLASEDFERLSARQEQFNPFKVLRVAHHEIRHSNVLAWLMDPFASHQFRDRFLRKFIAQVLLNSDNEEHKELPADISSLITQDFSDVEIRREYKNIDLLVISESNKLVLLIENKVRAKESRAQLKRYEAIVNAEFGDYMILRIFLTLDNAPPQNADTYLVGSHLDVLGILDHLSEIYGSRIPDRERQFIDDYRTILREELGMDQKLVELCRKIYSEHREAIDLINEHGNYDKDLEPAGIRFLSEHKGQVRQTFLSSRWVWFYPEEFEDLPRLGDDKWNGGTRQVIACYFKAYGDEKLKIILEVGPFRDPKLRARFLQHLNLSGFPMSEKAMAPERSYKRLYAATESIADWSDEDKILEGMKKLFSAKKAQDSIKRLKEAADSFNWGLK